MAQLRQEYSRFVELGAEIIAVGPEDPESFRKYWTENQMPFVGLADPNHEAADLYGQEVSMVRFGRMPSLFVIDADGRVVFSHYANSMADIPANSEVLTALAAPGGQAAAGSW
jgi:peroxiredoxin Q/BCP